MVALVHLNDFNETMHNVKKYICLQIPMQELMRMNDMLVSGMGQNHRLGLHKGI